MEGILMKRGKRFLGFFIFVLALHITVWNSAEAQFLNLGKENFERRMQWRVTSYDQFKRRFNLEKSIDGETIAEKQKTEALRRKYLASLFAPSYFTEKPPMKLDARVQALNFINEVISDSLYLPFSDTGVTAVVDFKGRYQGEIVVLEFQLHREYGPQGGSKWVLDSVVAPFLVSKLEDTSRFITPNRDGTSFMSLTRYFTMENHSREYYPKNFKPDHLSLFYMAIENGTLELLSSLDMKYVLNLAKYTIHIDYYNTKDDQSGWLISKLHRSP